MIITLRRRIFRFILKVSQLDQMCLRDNPTVTSREDVNFDKRWTLLLALRRLSQKPDSPHNIRGVWLISHPLPPSPFNPRLQVFFRRIDVLNENVVPEDGPIILVGNHANQFIDGMNLVASSNRWVNCFPIRSTPVLHLLTPRVVFVWAEPSVFSSLRSHMTEDISEMSPRLVLILSCAFLLSQS